MKKSGLLLTIIMILSVLVMSVSAQTPCSNDMDCRHAGLNCDFPEGPACYEGYCSCGIDGEPNLGECGLNADSNCFFSSEEPGCTDTECCIDICLIDEYCCNVEWDSICVDEAEEFCGVSEQPTGTFTVEGMFLGFDITENILKNKLLFTLHIIKDNIFQAELKIMEKSIIENGCDQPVSFGMSKLDYPYGKVEELHALTGQLIDIFMDKPELNPDGNVELAKAAYEFGWSIIFTNTMRARDCFVEAYGALAGEILACGCFEGCPAALALCGEACVDTNTDPNNCGGCADNGGDVCNGEIPGCCDGSCTDFSQPETCGSCTNNCNALASIDTQVPAIGCCSGTCANLGSDESNCGECGNACDEGETCCGLGDQCVNTLFGKDGAEGTTLHCGECGNTCSSAENCINGACVPINDE